MSSTSLLWVGMPRGRWHSSWFGGLCCKPSPLMQQGIYWRELYPRALIESWHEPYGADCFPFRLRIQGPREDRNMYMYGWIPLVFTWSLFTTLLIGCIPIQNKKWKKKKALRFLASSACEDTARKLEKEMATHSGTLAWKIQWTEKPGRLQSMWSQRVGHNWATSLHFTSEGPYPAVVTVHCSVTQSLSLIGLFATPWTAASQASLSFTISLSLLRLMCIESVMPSNHLILCHPLLLLPSICPCIRVFSNEMALHIRWPKYWSFSFSISPSNEYSELISFRIY